MTDSPDPDTTQSALAPSAPRRRWPRWLLIGGGIAVLLVILLVLLIPTLLSTGPGGRWVMGMVSDAVQGTVSADDLSFAWFGGQSIHGLTQSPTPPANPSSP